MTITAPKPSERDREIARDLSVACPFGSQADWIEHISAALATARREAYEDAATIADQEAEKMDGVNADRYWQSRRISGAILERANEQ